jgi:hypothetical protein
MTFFLELDKTVLILYFHMEIQKTPTAKAILSKNSNARDPKYLVSNYAIGP